MCFQVLLIGPPTDGGVSGFLRHRTGIELSRDRSEDSRIDGAEKTCGAAAWQKWVSRARKPSRNQTLVFVPRGLDMGPGVSCC